MMTDSTGDVDVGTFATLLPGCALGMGAAVGAGAARVMGVGVGAAWATIIFWTGCAKIGGDKAILGETTTARLAAFIDTARDTAGSVVASTRLGAAT